MLKYGLELAHYIPSGECWQGDCLFTKDSKRTEEILGKEYITFQPNKIIYAFSEDNPGYEEVKNADFGIAFHTIYSGQDKKQSFKVDVSRLNVPSSIYVMSPALTVNKKSFNLGKLKSGLDHFNQAAADLLAEPNYDELCSNVAFRTYWDTFENASLADKKATTINETTFLNDLKDYIKNKQDKEFEKKLASLKTEKGREKATQKYNQDVEELATIIDSNQGLLKLIVRTFNLAAQVKMLLWEGFKQTQTGYETFYKSKTKGHFPADMEGVRMSDQDGNIVKIVDRSAFSSYNRDPDIESGWERESLEEHLCFTETFNKVDNNELSLYEKFNRFIESNEPPLVVAFGRLNPVTKGHRKLVDTMASLAKGEKARLYLSHTQDKKKNPLSYEQKIKWAKDAFEPEINVVESEARTVVEVLRDLYNEGFKNIIYVGGEDRIGGDEDISSLILKYNGQPDKNGNVLYDFDSIQFKNAGARNDTSDDLVERASASLARQYAKDGNFESFKEIVPVENAEELYKEVRSGLGVSENLQEDLNKLPKSRLDKIGSILKNALQSGIKDIALRYVDLVPARHPLEILRVGSTNALDAEDFKDKILNALNSNFPTGEEVNDIDNRTLIFKDFVNDISIHAGASRSEPSIPIRLVTNDSEAIDVTYYITILAGSKAQKKTMTPNKVLLSNCIGDFIGYKSLEFNRNYSELKKLYESAIEHVKGDPDSVYTSHADDVSFITKNNANNIMNDFGEVLSAGCLAALLGNTSQVKFPSASNMPLVDFIVMNDEREIKVSQKANSGSSPSIDAAFKEIRNEDPGTVLGRFIS